MTKFIEIGWDYVPNYGNYYFYYLGQISVPVNLLQEVVDEDLSQEDNLSKFVEKISENMAIYLEKVEGKPSEVDPDAVDLRVSLEDNHSPAVLDTMKYDSLFGSLLDAIGGPYEDYDFHLSTKWGSGMEAIKYLCEKMLEYEAEAEAEAEAEKKEKRSVQIVREFSSLIAEYKSLGKEVNEDFLNQFIS